MTIQETPGPARPPGPSDRSDQAGQPVAVEVLACGSHDRGDDGAPIAAASLISEHLPSDVRVRIVGQLDIDHLLAIPTAVPVVIVDAAVGIPPGEIVELPVNGFVGRKDGLRPRSSHALSLPEVVGLAELIRGRPVEGRIVAIGGVDFGLGETLSERVSTAVPALTAAIRHAIDRVRATDPAGRGA
jgi:hydrogenase maturation protease